MKVALYVAELDIKGGTHKQVLRLAEHLLATGHQVIVLTPFYDLAQTYAGFSAINVIHVPAARPGRLLPYLQLVMRMPKVDVLHIHDNRGVAFFAAAKLLCKAKVTVWQINDLHPSFKQGNSSGLVLRRRSIVHRIANRWMARTVDAITVNVGKNVRRVSELLHSDAHLFYCGVDLPVAEASLPAPPDADAPQRPFRLMSMGTFVKYRNYETLLEGAHIARQGSGREVDATIVGDSRHDPAYSAMISDLAVRLRLRLTVLSNLSDAELADQIAACDAFAFVNLDQSWGLAVFEAAAGSRPVILSQSVGAAEVLSGKPGFLIVDPLSASSIGSAIVKMMNDAEGRVQHGRAARLAVERMTWASTYGAPVLNLYRQLLTHLR